MPINLASTLKLLTFLANHNGKLFFLFGNLMFFGVGNTMEVVKHPDFAPFLCILILLNSLVQNRVNDSNRGHFSRCEYFPPVALVLSTDYGPIPSFAFIFLDLFEGTNRICEVIGSR